MYRKTILFSALIGFVLLFPFVYLELVNRAAFHEMFPIQIFAFTWFLQSAFIYLIASIIVDAHEGKSINFRGPMFIIRIYLLILVVSVWYAWIDDQWSCLMGVLNCD